MRAIHDLAHTPAPRHVEPLCWRTALAFIAVCSAAGWTWLYIAIGG